ncbi:MAG: TlpA family protein disulfide reductase [Candidatus Limnocylindria bacterium]
MSQQARQSRRDAARRRERAAARPRWLLPALAVVAVVAIGGVAVVLGGAGGDTSPLPSGSAGASSGPVAAPTITGSSLPRFEDPTGDPAVGQVAPTVVGSSFDGSPVTIGGTGRPAMIVFLAHWCNHCQAEVPVVQAWLDRGSLPDGVDLVSVSTSTDPSAPNYPPDEWLAREGWTPPVAVDPTGSIAQAFGLSAFPYFVFVDADGLVVGRQVGELALEVLDQVAAALTP